MSTSNNTPGLTQRQMEFFRTFGFFVFRELFTEHEMKVIQQEHQSGLSSAFPDEAFSDEIAGQWTRMNDENTPCYASMPEDPRVLVPAQQLCGKDVIGNGTDAHFALGNTNWHADTGWQPDFIEKREAVKYHFTLDPVTAETGALRFVPGTHLLRGKERVLFGQNIDEMSPEDVPCHAAATHPGDVIIFDIRIWHASIGGPPGRRTSNIEYFSNPDTEEAAEKLREIGRLQANSRNANKYTFSKNWIENPHDSPHRTTWIKKLMDIGYFDQPGVGEL